MSRGAGDGVGDKVGEVESSSALPEMAVCLGRLGGSSEAGGMKLDMMALGTCVEGVCNLELYCLQISPASFGLMSFAFVSEC